MLYSTRRVFQPAAPSPTGGCAWAAREQLQAAPAPPATCLAPTPAVGYAGTCRSFLALSVHCRPRAAQRRGPPIVAVSAPQRNHGTLAAASPSPQAPAKREAPAVPVKIVGVGTRGASALAKLVQHDKVAGAELWCLDVDKKVTDMVPGARTVLVPKEGLATGGAEQGPVSSSDLVTIVGRGASDAGGRGNVGIGDGSLSFVVAPAAAVPGGPQVVMQLVAALRAAGHFVVVALTHPFDFEGGPKADQAARLLAAVRSSAHLVAVMEQDVLMQAFGDSQLTVAEATDIADNALEHTVRAVLQAVQAQEVLKSSRGALMWHARDTRHCRRLLSTPLMQLLTSADTAALGRGLAGLPGEVAQKMGPAQAMMHLASDAVGAAAESPFLEGALETASAVLCCLSLPAGSEAAKEHSGTSQRHSSDAERHATRMAAQAAAGALTSITGRQCQEFVVCAEPRLMELAVAAAAAGSGKVEVEATLLVLRPYGGPSASPVASAPRQATPYAAAPAPELQQGGPVTDGPAMPLTAPQDQTRTGPKRLPPTSWNALSAMAGGAASPAARGPAPPAQSPAAASGAPSQQQEGAAPQGPSPGYAFFQGGAKAGSKPPTMPPPQQGAPRQGGPQMPSTASARPPPAVAGTGAGAAAPRKDISSGATPQQLPLQQQQQQAAQPPKITTGDYLVESLTAQSLDLPPAAAKWRQAHRTNEQHQRKLIVWEVDEVEPWEEEEGEEPEGLAGLLLGGLRKERRRVNLRERVSGVLQQDREEAWQQDEEGAR